MIDEILSKENEEVEALVSMLEERPHEVSPDLDETSTYSSDEESYEAVFAEVLRAFPEEDTSTCNARQAGGGSGEQGKDYEAMDTTG